MTEKVIMNEPVDYQYTTDDIKNEFKIYRDKKKVAKKWGITSKEVDFILKTNK